MKCSALIPAGILAEKMTIWTCLHAKMIRFYSGLRAQSRRIFLEDLADIYQAIKDSTFVLPVGIERETMERLPRHLSGNSFREYWGKPLVNILRAYCTT